MDALTLANTLRAHRGRGVDVLDPESGLHELRETIRALFELLNRLARAPRLRWDREGPQLEAEDDAAEAARTAIELLAGGRIRRCGNPRCTLYYLAGGRRLYCSQTCGNRTRVARHAGHARPNRKDYT